MKKRSCHIQCQAVNLIGARILLVIRDRNYFLSASGKYTRTDAVVGSDVFVGGRGNVVFFGVDKRGVS